MHKESQELKMDKESIIALQKLDCNCNDCKFMVRNIVKYRESQERHREWQFSYFTTIKNKMIEKAQAWIAKGEEKKGQTLLKEAGLMKFQHENTSYINYGTCMAFNKEVSFIPNTLQLETQQCFIHRKDGV